MQFHIVLCVLKSFVSGSCLGEAVAFVPLPGFFPLGGRRS